MSRGKPIHRQIADEIRQRIVAGHYEGEGLPPEMTLKDEFKVSRHTIRSALQSLVQDGLIERRAGHGTHQTERVRGGAWAIGSLESMIGEFSIEKALTLKAELIPASRVPRIAALFKTHKKGKLFHVARIFPAEDPVFAISNTFTSANLAPYLPTSEIAQQPVIAVVEQRCGLRSVRARQLASAAAADEDTAQRLDMPVGDPILVLHRTYFNSDDEPLVHTEMFCRPDRYQQVVDFVREANRELQDTSNAPKNGAVSDVAEQGVRAISKSRARSAQG